MSRSLFVNLPVRDLTRSMEFFAALGFAFNPQFTDDKAACMVIGEDAYVMLLSEPFFATFTGKQVADAAAVTEAIFCLSAASRDEVDTLVRTALAEGGKPAADPIDHGAMYGWSFQDVDGHQWEVMWMDPAELQPAPAAS